MLVMTPSRAASPLVRFDAADPQRLARALADLKLGCIRWRLAMALAWLDLRNRYRGSVLGPFWLTLSTGVMLGGLGFLYAALFKMDVTEYLPWLGTSLIIWNVIAQVLGEGCVALTSAEGIVRQMSLPFTVHALRCVFRNALVAAHNLPLILVVFLLCGIWPGPAAVLAIPGLLLLMVNGFAATMFLGMLCARFRDIGQIVGSVIQIAFFMTPIIWKPDLLHINPHWLLLNPFFALMETVRAPLLERGGDWAVWTAAVGFTLLNCGLAFAFFVRFRARIAFWV